MIDQSEKPIVLYTAGETFTRSNGSLLSRLYERLTRASRRRSSYVDWVKEKYYRRGVYDAYNALIDELT